MSQTTLNQGISNSQIDEQLTKVYNMILQGLPPSTVFICEDSSKLSYVHELVRYLNAHEVLVYIITNKTDKGNSVKKYQQIDLDLKMKNLHYAGIADCNSDDFFNFVSLLALSEPRTYFVTGSHFWFIGAQYNDNQPNHWLMAQNYINNQHNKTMKGDLAFIPVEFVKFVSRILDFW